MCSEVTESAARRDNSGGMNEYDYVIVGAGSAGCVLAARLGADPDTRVLVLEAGPPDDAPEMRIPAATPTLWNGPYAWNNPTTPQQHAGGRVIQWPSGRTLGGSSSINGMVYIRGNAVDYDTWRDEFGCTGWGYADLLPYFRRAEDQQRGESAFHGTGGPLRIEDQRYRHVLTQSWVSAAETYGLPRNDDFNGAAQDGVGFFQLTCRDGARWSAADGYLRPAISNGNVAVETGALVGKVLIEHDRAVGVRYQRDGAEYDVRARQEVLLCAGAVQSPRLLMLSGIGPADQLCPLGIDVLLDKPLVGEQLQDHPACAPQWSTPNTPNLFEEATPENMALWQEKRIGPMTSNGPEAGGFGRSRGDLAAPDLQFGVAPGPGPDQLMAHPDRRGISLLVVAVAVRSRGRVALRSADPADKPMVDPAYLSAEADVDALLAGIRLQREIAACEPLASHLGGEYAPGEDVADLREWVRNTATTIFHPTSTCAMGAAPDSVCDLDLRVRGVDGLRVVDASVMPQAPRGNTYAPTIAIAERAADLIRGRAPLPGCQV